ncbi:unnamed protein product [Agarophyton chilense]
MGERKVQAKYYPPDFDPAQLPRIKKKKQTENAVRFMLPMSVRCESCGEFMGTGLKFNAKKSDSGENYLGIRIFRFSMKCKSCPTTFTIKTDPKNSDYICESGVRRNYEPWKEEKRLLKEGKEERERQDQDAMQALENKTIDSKKELEDLDVLNELKTASAQRASISIDDILARSRVQQRNLEDEVEAQLREQARILFKNKQLAAQFKSILPKATTSDVFGFGENENPSASFGSSDKVVLKVRRKIKKSRSIPIKRNIGPIQPLVGLAEYSSSSGSD